MLRLNHSIIFLVLWLGFFFNIERLHVQKTEVVDIAGSVYVLAIVVALLGLILPQYFTFSRFSVGLGALLLFVVVKVIDGRPWFDANYLYVSLVEALGILITAFLAYAVGMRTADFVQTVRKLLFADIQHRVMTPVEAAPILERELQAARRSNQPLTVTIVEAHARDRHANLNATANEIQNLLARRYQLVALTRLLTGFIRSTDIVLDQSDKGRIIVVTPELTRAQVAILGKRLGELAHAELGVSLHRGSATFPEQGLTLEELIYQAEQMLKPETEANPPEILAGSNGSSPEDGHKINVSYGPSAD